MKVKAVRYGRVIPARDGTKFSTDVGELGFIVGDPWGCGEPGFYSHRFGSA